jgi:hypothetical protein
MFFLLLGSVSGERFIPFHLSHSNFNIKEKTATIVFDWISGRRKMYFLHIIPWPVQHLLDDKGRAVKLITHSHLVLRGENKWIYTPTFKFNLERNFM